MVSLDIPDALNSRCERVTKNQLQPSYWAL